MICGAAGDVRGSYSHSASPSLPEQIGDPLTAADIAVHGEALADSSKYAPHRCQVGRKVVWLPVKEHKGPAGQGRGETRAVIKSSRQCPGSQPNA